MTARNNKLVERHELHHEGSALEIRIDLEADGSVWINVGAEVMSPDTLQDIVTFLGDHTDVEIVGRG